VSYYADDEVDKAVALYFRHAERNGLTVMQPNRYDCERIGKTVYIRTGDRVLARYRVCPDGYLRMAC
jgi:hypothetical protein